MAPYSNLVIPVKTESRRKAFDTKMCKGLLGQAPCGRPLGWGAGTVDRNRIAPSPGPRSETQRRGDDGVVRGASVTPRTRSPLELLELLHDGFGGDLVGEAPADALPDNGARLVDQEYRRGCKAVAKQVEDLITRRDGAVTAGVKHGNCGPTC